MEHVVERRGLGPFAVAPIGFGAMRLTGPNVFGPPRDRRAAIRVLREAAERGVDHIDTAQFYGPNIVNELIREALHPYPPELIIVSKVGARRDSRGSVIADDEPGRLRRAIEENLRTLDLAAVPIVNLRLRRESQPVLEECTRQGIAFVPFGSLGFGGTGPDAVLQRPAVVEQAVRLGATPAQVVLAWALALAPNMLLIPGASSVDHLRENLAASAVRLDPEAVDRLSAM